MSDDALGAKKIQQQRSTKDGVAETAANRTTTRNQKPERDTQQGDPLRGQARIWDGHHVTNRGTKDIAAKGAANKTTTRNPKPERDTHRVIPCEGKRVSRMDTKLRIGAQKIQEQRSSRRNHDEESKTRKRYTG